MTDSQNSFLNLFFDEGESFSLSTNHFGYKSIDRQALKSDPFLNTSNNDKKTEKVHHKDINMMCINPVNGPRRDSNVTSFRSFLIEMDEGSLKEQKKYIESLGMPYSTCVFSGSKSLHYAIVLDKPCADISVWKTVNQWILNIVEKADQQVSNPTVSIRFPDNIRHETGKEQKMIYLGKRVTRDELNIWLNKFLDKKPTIKPPRPKNILPQPLTYQTLQNLPDWIKQYMQNGVEVERNATWFRIACFFANKGFGVDDFFNVWENIFEEEKDFTKKEWETTIRSAYKRVLDYV